jgi:hypothetical protein
VSDGLSPDCAWGLRAAEPVLSNSQFSLDRFQSLYFPLKNAHICHLATEGEAQPTKMPTFGGPPTALLTGRADKHNFRKG